MGRSKSPWASIIHLKALLELYIRTKNIPKFPGKISESRFIEALGDCLEKDKILKKKSANLVNKLRGLPFQSSSESSEGIDTEKLDKIAAFIIHEYELDKRWDINADEFQWNIFEQKSFEVPDHLRHVQDFKYYKFLSHADKVAVDGFVERKISELILYSDDLHNYCMYYWDELNKKINVALLQINKKEETAVLKYVQYENEKWSSKSVQRTNRPGGLFQMGDSTCFLNFAEEDDKKLYLRTNICLSVHTSDFYSLKYIKGTYSTSRQHAGMPVAGELLLEKKRTFQEATKTSQEKVDNKIEFELLGQRIAIKDTQTRSFEDFRSYNIQKVLSRISGAYVLGFFKNRGGSKKVKLAITRGICFIEESGRVTMQISDSTEIIHGYVNNNIHYDNSIICITNFFDKSTDSFKYNYILKLIKDNKNSFEINELSGIYAGVTELLPRSGKIVFLRTPGNFGNFEQLKMTGIEFGRLLDLKKLNSEEKELYKKLIEQTYFILP